MIAPAAKNEEPPKNTAAPPNRKLLTQRSGFHDAPRAEEIAAVFKHRHTRATLSHVWQGRGGKQIWELIVTALDAGLIMSTDKSVHAPTMALLLPSCSVSFTKQYDLSNQKVRTHVRDIVLPSMIACRDKLVAEPDRIREILSDHEKAQRGQQQAAVVAKKRAVAVAALPGAEQELMMFGQPVWPRIDISQGEYDYDQVRAAIWTFRDYESWNQMAKENIGSHALRIRNSLRYLGEYLQRTDRDNPMAKILSLMIWFSYLMEKNPAAPCKWPHYPHNEGQW